MGTCYGDGNVFYKLQLIKMRREQKHIFRVFRPAMAKMVYVLDGGGPKDSENILN